MSLFFCRNLYFEFVMGTISCDRIVNTNLSPIIQFFKIMVTFFYGFFTFCSIFNLLLHFAAFCQLLNLYNSNKLKKNIKTKIKTYQNLIFHSIYVCSEQIIYETIFYETYFIFLSNYHADICRTQLQVLQKCTSCTCVLWFQFEIIENKK